MAQSAKVGLMFLTYILLSQKTQKYYVGHTNDFERRFEDHNKGLNKSTKSGMPWSLVKYFRVKSKSEAVKLEIKIKKRGIARFLKDIN